MRSRSMTGRRWVRETRLMIAVRMQGSYDLGARDVTRCREPCSQPRRVGKGPAAGKLSEHTRYAGVSVVAGKQIADSDALGHTVYLLYSLTRKLEG